MIIARRPPTRPTPVTTPADGAPPHSAYISHAAHRPSSKKIGAGIDQARDALAGGEPVLLVLAVDGLRAAALADGGFLLAQCGEQCEHAGGVGLLAFGFGVEF